MLSWTIFICIVIHLSVTVSYPADSGVPAKMFLPGRQVGKVQTNLIKEASGMAASRKNPGILWVHNDSGNSANIYALNAEGKLLRICRIDGANCRDWEDIAVGPGPDKKLDYLYIGDIGDNKARYSSVIIYRVPEPKVDPNEIQMEIRTKPAETIELVYPDGPKDAETLMVDPLNGDIYIISKRKIFCRVYYAPYPQSTQKQTQLTPVAVLPWALAVGGDISPDGRYIIVRSLTHASLWQRQKDQPLRQAFNKQALDIKLIMEPQGEAICFDAKGHGFFTVSEKANQPIYYYAESDESKKQD
ncbi:MAG: hypothetical protein JW715_08860 [Sedimentisphaerales bacterium]|nr:hypothetical protein [Sedimentisphaerales bacterium]